MKNIIKRSITLSIVFITSILVFLGYTNEADATAHPSIQFRDGNATWSNGYRPHTHAHDVDPTIKNRWESGNLSNFVRGGKYPRKGPNNFEPTKGNRLGYDVYYGHTNNANKQGWKITKSGGKDFFTFDGWAVNHGYYHHDRHNQATYIGLRNKKRPSERKIYKAEMTGLNGTNDLRWNHVPDRKCPNTGSGSLMKYNSTCNMEYRNVSFRAHLPLDDLFQRGDEEWEFYIIKAVKGHSGMSSSGHINGARYVYAPLILPFEKEIEDWGNDKIGQGELTLSSGRNLGKMTMVTARVTKRATPRGTDGSGYFEEGRTYNWVRQDESSGVTVWHGVRDGNSVRYASSMYWDFGGEIATLTWKKSKFDVTIRHIDASTNNETVLEQQVRTGLSGTHTFHPYSRDKFKNGVGYQLVPVDSPKTVNVNRDMRIDFRYKASLPDPTRIVEVGGGENTHGHAEGEALWELFKGERSVDLPDNVESDFEWRDVEGGVEITKYLGNRKGVAIPLQLDGKNVVSLGANSFENKEITYVSIPFSVTNIGNRAFYNNSLESVIIPNNVTTIGQNAFSNNDLYNIVIPESVRTIGNQAFSDNQLNTIELQDGVEQIGNGAFRNNHITEVNFPDSVTNIGTDAFRNNNISLALVYNAETQFGSNVFADNQENPRDLTMFGYDPSTAKTYATTYNHTFRSFENPESEFLWRDVEGGVEIIKYIGNDQIVGIPRQLDQKDVVSLGEDSFYEKRLIQVMIPDTVKKIGDKAFSRNDLTNVIIPNSVTSIGVGAFEYNKLVTVEIPNSVTELG